MGLYTECARPVLNPAHHKFSSCTVSSHNDPQPATGGAKWAAKLSEHRQLPGQVLLASGAELEIGKERRSCCKEVQVHWLHCKVGPDTLPAPRQHHQQTCTICPFRRLDDAFCGRHRLLRSHVTVCSLIVAWPAWTATCRSWLLLLWQGLEQEHTNQRPRQDARRASEC